MRTPAFEYIPPHINARADRNLSRVAHRLIRKEPADRYQTAEEVAEALNE